MSLNIKAMIIIFLYAIVSNLFLISLANTSSSSIDCQNVEDSFETDYGIVNYTTDDESKEKAIPIINLALNRCTGLSSWVFWITQVPSILGLLYVIRGFIGLT